MKQIVFIALSWAISALILIPCLLLWMMDGVDYHHEFHKWWARFPEKDQ